MGYHKAGAFFDCSEVVAVVKKSEKNKVNKKNRKGDNGNEEEGKSPLDGISASAEMIIRSFHIGSQCG